MESDDDEDSSVGGGWKTLRRKRRGKKNHRRIVLNMLACKYDVPIFLLTTQRTKEDIQQNEQKTEESRARVVKDAPFRLTTSAR